MDVMTRRVRAALIATAVLVALGSCTSSNEQPPAGAPEGNSSPAAVPSSPPETSKDTDEGQPDSWDGPDFTVETFDGVQFALGEQAGTPVVLNFWESW